MKQIFGGGEAAMRLLVIIFILITMIDATSFNISKFRLLFSLFVRRIMDKNKHPSCHQTWWKGGAWVDCKFWLGFMVAKCSHHYRVNAKRETHFLKMLHGALLYPIQ